MHYTPFVFISHQYTRFSSGNNATGESSLPARRRALVIAKPPPLVVDPERFYRSCEHRINLFIFVVGIRTCRRLTACLYAQRVFMPEGCLCPKGAKKTNQQQSGERKGTSHLPRLQRGSRSLYPERVLLEVAGSLKTREVYTPLRGAQTVGVYATSWLRLPQTPFSAVSAVLGCVTMGD